jgi:hypothetical protein
MNATPASGSRIGAAFLAAVLACTLAGCGAGSGAVDSSGSGGGTPPPPTQPPPPTTGSATVSWLPPTTNSDGTALTNLAGYHIYYGTSAASLSQVIKIANVGITTYVIDNLAAGTYYFAVSSYTSTGIEGELSAVASKTI